MNFVVVDPITNDTVHQSRFGEALPSSQGQTLKLVPFGAKVDFRLPRVNEPDHHGQLKFEPRGEAGLFMGWHFDPGHKWLSTQ